MNQPWNTCPRISFEVLFDLFQAEFDDRLELGCASFQFELLEDFVGPQVELLFEKVAFKPFLRN